VIENGIRNAIHERIFKEASNTSKSKTFKKKTQGELKRKSLRQGRIIKVKSGEIKCDGYLEK